MRAGSSRGLACSLNECLSLLCVDHSVSHLPLSMTLLPPQVLWRQIVLLTRGPCLAFVKAQGPRGEFPHHIEALKLLSFKIIVDAFNYWIIPTWLYLLCYCVPMFMVSVSWYLLVLPQSRFQMNWAGWCEKHCRPLRSRGQAQQWNLEVQYS